MENPINQTPSKKRQCQECGIGLSFFNRKNICPSCKKIKKKNDKEARELLSKEIHNIKESLKQGSGLSDPYISLIRNLSKTEAIGFYNEIFSHYVNDKELNETEFETLAKIQDALSLSNEEISYVNKVLPYAYALSIRTNNKLPTPTIQFADNVQMILKKDEVIHFSNPAILCEKKIVRVGYSGGSRGVSIRIMKGVSYRVGAHRGQVIKEEQLIPTSKGALLITNQRLFLHPAAGNKPLSLPLDKIISYNCYETALEVFKDGREKGYIFRTSSGAVEIFSICLGFILSNKGIR